MLKPVYSTLRQQGHNLFGYIDDSFSQGDNYTDCKHNVNDSSALFEQLGFIVDDEKSVTTPTQQLVLLGLILMTMSLTPARTKKRKISCEQLYKKQRPTVQEVADVVGLMVASFPAVLYAQPYYRALEIDKCEALKNNYGNFKAVL